MNVQTVYTFACILLLLLQACQGSECGRHMFQSLYTAFHVSKHWLIRTPVLSDTCRMLNKCAEHIYIFACMVFLVSQAFLGSECGGCMFQLLFTASHVSGHQLSRTPVLSDTCRLLNECADCIYICMHAVPWGSSMAGTGMCWTHVSIIVHCIPCIRTLV